MGLSKSKRGWFVSPIIIRYYFHKRGNKPQIRFLLVLVSLLFPLQALAIVAEPIGGGRARSGGDDVLGGAGNVRGETGKQNQKRLVVIGCQQQDEDDGEGKNAAALKPELGVDGLDGGLEREFEVLRMVIGYKRRLCRL